MKKLTGTHVSLRQQFVDIIKLFECPYWDHLGLYEYREIFLMHHYIM